MSSTSLGMLVAGVAIVVWVIATYRRLRAAKLKVSESWVALEAQLRRHNDLIPILDAHPDLQCNENFNRIHSDLKETEILISQARSFYEANVRHLNSAIETFPTVLVAGPLGFKEVSFYGPEKRADEPDR